MTPNQDEVVREYADRKIKIKALEAENEMIAPLVMARIKELAHDKDKYTLEIRDVGTISILQKRKYEYSQATQDTETQLKEAKKREEQDGTAKIVNYTEYMQFRVKEKGNE